MKIEKKTKIFVCCTEQSGENICFNLLNKFNDEYIIDGVCGHKSSALIRKKYYDISEFKSIGIFEIIFSLLKYIKMINFLSKKIIKNNYDLIICIDSPDFNYNLIKKIRNEGFKNKVIQIVAPTVWAWRSGRAHKFSKIYDEIFTLFDFEKKYFEKYGLKVTYIGHPIFYIKSINSNKTKKLIAFLPGSRKNEVKKLFIYFECLYKYILSNNLNFDIFIPTLPHLDSLIKKMTSEWKIKTIITSNFKESEMYFNHVFISVTCSGTASLEISKRLIPQLVIYKLNFFTVLFFRTFIRVKYANLLNIVKDEMIIPELVNFKLNKKNLIIYFEKYLIKKNNRENQVNKLKIIMPYFDTIKDPYKICIERIKKIL